MPLPELPKNITTPIVRTDGDPSKYDEVFMTHKGPKSREGTVKGQIPDPDVAIRTV